MKFADYLLNESKLEPSVLPKDDQEKIKEYILDALKEFKVSVRQVEFESRSVVVYYNFGDEAPKGYRTDRNDIRTEITSEVKDIIKDVGYSVTSTVNKLEADNVGLVRFTLKV